MLKAGALQKAIFNSVNFSSIATDAKGVIQIFNVGAERMLGYAAADVMNRITPADISDPQQVIARAKTLSSELGTQIKPGFEALVFKASRGIEDIYELTYIRKDGSRFPAVVSVTALRDDQEAIIGYLLIGTDNTARQQVEAERTRIEQLLAKKNQDIEFIAAKLHQDDTKLIAQQRELLEVQERMVQIDRLSSLGVMVGGVAHEINNPLMGVLNYVEFARDRSDDAKSIEVLNKALHEIGRIKKIVQNMLVFARVDHHANASCRVADAVKQALSLMEGEFKKNAVLMRLDLPEDLPPVHCSAGSLQQVLVNLMLNARDALAQQADRQVNIRASQIDSKVVVSVCDSGPGVSEEVRQKLFTPFFTTKAAGKGTGLGLAVSRQLIEEVGGTISFAPEPGFAACFRMELSVA